MTSLSGFGSMNPKWYGTTFAPNSNKLYGAPNRNSNNSVLIVDFKADSAVLQPFRLAARQQVLIASLETQVASQSVSISALQVAVATQTTTITALQSVSSSVCSRPLCGNGTIASNGECIPDCTGLRRRAISCEPFCQPTAPTTSPLVSPTPPPDSVSGSGGGSVGVAVGATFAVVVVGVGLFICNRRGGQRHHLPPLPPQSQIVSMFVNPLHHGVPEPATDYEEPVMLHPAERPRVDVDSELYVANQRTPSADASYAVFRDVHPGGGVSGLREAAGVTSTIPLEGGLLAASDYVEVSGGTAGAAGPYAVFQSAGMDATA
eukprot:m.37448 g.37448  ORF g.37448 m.37448 type:complete len:320 (+) comp13094_c0_seq1:1555-2514(+)